MKKFILLLSLITLLSFNFEAQAFGGIGRAIGKFFGISDDKDKKQEFMMKRKKEICKDKLHKDSDSCKKLNKQ